MSERFHSAFISYKHSDMQHPGHDWVSWVHGHLEGYVTPKELAGNASIYKDPVPALIAHVFRDKNEIPGTGSLREIINPALEKSRILVVLCSPAAAASREVEAEVRFFKNHNKNQPGLPRIVALIIGGTPHAEKPELECLCPSLAYELDSSGNPDHSRPADPVYIDLRSAETQLCATSSEAYAERLRSQRKYAQDYIDEQTAAYGAHLVHCRISLISGVLGLPPGEMTERERLAQIEAEEQRKKEAAQKLLASQKQTHVALAACAVLTCCLVAAIYFAWKEKQTSAELQASLQREETQRQEAGSQRQKTEEANYQLTQKDKEAQSLRDDLRSYLADLVGLTDWGSGIKGEVVRPILEKSLARIEKNMPEDTDATGQDYVAACYNRLGDILHESTGGQFTMAQLTQDARDTRKKALQYYQSALTANLKKVALSPLESNAHSNLSVTYARVGNCLLDQSTILSGVEAATAAQAALEQLRLAEMEQIKARELAATAAGGQQLTAWFDATLAYQKGAVAMALKRLAELQPDSLSARNQWREVQTARANARDFFHRAIATANSGSPQPANVLPAVPLWQEQATALQNQITETERVMLTAP